MSHRYVMGLGLLLVLGNAACVADEETDEGLTTETVGSTEPNHDDAAMRAHFLGDVDVTRVDSPLPSPDRRRAPDADPTGRRARSFGNARPDDIRPLPAPVAPLEDCVSCR